MVVKIKPGVTQRNQASPFWVIRGHLLLIHLGEALLVFSNKDDMASGCILDAMIKEPRSTPDALLCFGNSRVICLSAVATDPTGRRRGKTCSS